VPDDVARPLVELGMTEKSAAADSVNLDFLDDNLSHDGGLSEADARRLRTMFADVVTGET
jgi:hypothetical protein